MVAYPGVAQLRFAARTDTTWLARANCVDANPNIFFDPERYGDALAVCAPCPVKEACRKSRGGADGVWGGHVYARRRRADTITYGTVHGTEAGYSRHRRHGETPCRACVAASTAARERRK